jgi:hypothetical protein
METKYNLGDKITAINGMPVTKFKGTIIGFDHKNGGYLVTCSEGWKLCSDRITDSDFVIDPIHKGRRIWHVPYECVQEPQIPSNELMSHLVDKEYSSNGCHAECYPHPKDRRKILLATNCPAREIMSKGKFPKSRYFPRPKNVGKLGYVNVYEMEKYIPVDTKKLSPLDKKIYIGLNRCGYSYYSLKEHKVIPKHIKKVILHARNMITKAGYEANFDNCSHNMMMTVTGQLVFTDLFFITKSQYKRK